MFLKAGKCYRGNINVIEYIRERKNQNASCFGVVPANAIKHTVINFLCHVCATTIRMHGTEESFQSRVIC